VSLSDGSSERTFKCDFVLVYGGDNIGCERILAGLGVKGGKMNLFPFDGCFCGLKNSFYGGRDLRTNSVTRMWR